MSYIVRLHTDYSPPQHELTLIPDWGQQAEISGSYRGGTWTFILPDEPAPPADTAFTVRSSLAGLMADKLPLSLSPNATADFGPNAIHFGGARPTQLRLRNWFDSTQARSVIYSGIRLLLALVLLVVLLAPLPIWAAIDGSRHGSSPDCPGISAPKVVPPVTKTPDFKLADTSTTSTHLLAFNRSRNTRMVAIILTPVAVTQSKLPTAATLTTTPATTINGFLTRDDGSTLNANLFSTQTVLQSGQVLVTICARRHDSHGTLGAPGTYTGIVSVAGADVVRTDIPIVVTLSYPAWQVVLELLALVLIPAAWYLWILHDSADPAKNQRMVLNWGLVQYTLRRVGFLSLAVGSLAAFSVYSATYLRNATWGSSVTQWLSLYGAMFTAFITAAGGVHLGAKASASKT
jgi:hypothetical protein